MKQITSAAMLTALAVFTSGEAFAQAAQQDINITATVPAYCSIAGGTNPAALTASVPVTANGTVNTAAIPFTVSNVVCNTAANVVATSQSGGVKNASSAPSGFSNIINYTGSATFGGATSTVDTSTVATATGPEAGASATTSGAAAGALNVSITPQTPSAPLIPGGYSDTLRITITPQ